MKKTITALLVSLSISTVAQADTINLSAIANAPVTCKANHKCDLAGIFDVTIINDTDFNQIYNYTYYICGDAGNNVDANRNQCDLKAGRINIIPHTKYHDNYEFKYKKIFIDSGTHVVTAEVQVTHSNPYSLNKMQGTTTVRIKR